MVKTEIFDCDYSGCQKAFTTRFSLRRHYLTHMGIKEHGCPYCKKRFSLSQYLKEHIYIHTGEKPFVCTHLGCGRRFRQAGKLSIHRKTHLMGIGHGMNSNYSPVTQEATQRDRSFFPRQFIPSYIPFTMSTYPLPLPPTVSQVPQLYRYGYSLPTFYMNKTLPIPDLQKVKEAGARNLSSLSERTANAAFLFPGCI